MAEQLDHARDTKMTALTAALTLTATGKAVEKVISDLYDLSKDKIREHTKRWRAQSKIKHLARKLSMVRKVKTIWQIEQEVDLLSFYHPSKLLKGTERKEVRSLTDLVKDGNVLVEGTVGQGKSIFLRHLCVQELYRGEIIPLFVELRRYEPNAKLVDSLLEVLDILGLGSDPDVFDFLASSGRMIICLDGFDEVKGSLRDRLIKQIETLCLKYDELRVVITSRPDNGIDKSPCFRVRRLAPLQKGDVRGIIDKLKKDAKFTDELMSAIEERDDHLDDLLTTPLMVTLLVIAYQNEFKIPETMAEFYESLFNTLLLRHDKLKSGFQRERKCGLNDRAVRSVFDAMSFLCRKQQLVTIENDVLYDICSKAKELAQADCEAEHFIDDVKHITCLLLEEGNKYHFIHKSVSEYHSASYIKRSPDEGAKQFYSKVLGGKYRNWLEELEFLQQIDEYRFSKLFLIPDVIGFLGENPAEKRKAADERAGVGDIFFNKIVEAVSQMRVGLNPDGRIRRLFQGSHSLSSWLYGKLSYKNVYNPIISADWRSVPFKEPKAPAERGGVRDSTIVSEVPIARVLGSTQVVEPRAKILLACKKSATEMKEEFLHAWEFVKKTEAATSEYDGI